MILDVWLLRFGRICDQGFTRSWRDSLGESLVLHVVSIFVAGGTFEASIIDLRPGATLSTNSLSLLHLSGERWP